MSNNFLQNVSQQPDIQNVRFTVVFNIPINVNTFEWASLLPAAAEKVSRLGLEVHNTHVQFPPCMLPAEI